MTLRHAIERFTLRQKVQDHLLMLKSQREELNLILQSMGDAMALFDLNQRLAFGNRLFWSFMPPNLEGLDACLSRLEVPLEERGRESLALREWVVHPPGSTPHHCQVLRLQPGGEDKGTLMILRDLSKEQTIDHLKEEVAKLESALSNRPRRGLIANCPAMQALLQQAEVAARSDLSILIRGQSGTGKEVFAKEIHRLSSRSDGPFVAINCGALPGNLIESELFGHRKGAFTGAVKDRVGLFEQARGGTLFLDEVGEMPLDLQVKLLRTLQERTLRKVGDDEEISIDVRILAATNADLDQGVRERTFREDLFYRLAEFPLNLPVLKERETDLVDIARSILEQQNESLGRQLSLAPDAIEAMLQHPWPGNIRELENCIKRAALVETEGQIRASTLNLNSSLQPASSASHPSLSGFMSLAEPRPLAEVERELIEKTLHHCQQNVTRAAQVLGINRVTLHRKLKTWSREA